MAYDAASSCSGPVYTLGPLIHNPQVVERLKGMGIDVCDNYEELPPGATVIIRSHGVPLEVLEFLRSRGVRIIDATCPFVKKAQDIVATLTNSEYHVVIVGDGNHPEVKALLSYGKGRASIFPHVPDGVLKLGVVSQTTQLLEKFIECIKWLIGHREFQEVRIYNTVCQSTAERQKECKRLAQEADLVIVVGGRNSANTKKLWEIASEEVEAYHIEVAEELNPSWFLGKRVIGITAGASTPEWIISEVVEEVKRITGGKVDGRG